MTYLPASGPHCGGKLTGHFMGMGGDFTQAIRPVPQGIKPRHNGQQNLCGADVRCGFFASDMLFTRLQGQPVGGLAMLVL